jgi:hypothetical protein
VPPLYHLNHEFQDLKPSVGRISKILARISSSLIHPNNVVIVVEVFIVSDGKDLRLNMPILVPSPVEQLLAIKPKVRVLS